MKCPDCGKELIKRDYHDRYDSCTEENYRVYCDYYNCVCGYTNVPVSALWGDLMIKAREKRWSEWIASKITSFKEIEDKFYTRSQVLSMIKNYNGEKRYPDSKKELVRCLDFWCLHFVLWGRKYYLKKSVEKYLRYRNGLFPLNEVF